MHRRHKNPTSFDADFEHEDPLLPYGGKVVLAKRKKADGGLALAVQGIALVFAVFLIYICYFHPSTLQFYVTWFYANLGYAHAQHLVGQKYLQGYGVESNNDNAIFWLSKAADQGHPVASYNLAVAHLNGMNVNIKKDQAHRLIRHAAKQGVEEAQKTLQHICSQEDCSEEK